MKRTLPKLSIEASLPPRNFGLPAPRPHHFTVLIKLHREPPPAPRRVPIEHFPSPSSPILFKIVATETHPRNAPRLNRLRQFYSRFHLA
jgi:hypothetical protein